MAEPIRYVCVEGHPSFTIEDIELAPAGDVRHDPAWDLVQALADYQANLGDASENIPKDGWLRVVDGPEEVVFLAEISEKGALYAVVNVVLASGGFHDSGRVGRRQLRPLHPTSRRPRRCLRGGLVGQHLRAAD